MTHMPKRPVGRPPKPVEMPSVPEQDCPSEDLTWYLVKAKPGQVWTATKRLRQDFGIAAWCPIGTIERRRNRHTIIAWGPLLPPYLFAGFGPDQGVGMLRDVIGVAGLSCSDGGKPQTIRAEVLIRLWERCQESDTPGALSRLPVGRGPWAAELKQGDPLVINDGPLLGNHGTFSHLEGENIKMWIVILRRPVLVTVSPNQVIRAK